MVIRSFGASCFLEIVVPFTCVAAESSKLLLWESLAAKAFDINASASVANMVRENNEDFITAP